MGKGEISGPYGSHERPASALYMRLGLALFGALVLLGATLFAVLRLDSIPLTVLLAGGTAVAAINVYWVSQRIRWER